MKLRALGIVGLTGLAVIQGLFLYQSGPDPALASAWIQAGDSVGGVRAHTTAGEEVTMAEVLSEAGYATAFYGKAHLGDVESSYLHTQGFDEALWTPYNQVPSLYVRRGQQSALYPTSMYPDMYPADKYALDNG